MGLIEALAAARGLRQFRQTETFALAETLRDHEPELSLPWEADDEPEAVLSEPEIVQAPAAREMFLVCEQAGMNRYGNPMFGRSFASTDDDLALSEDGYLINGAGQFLLGMPLGEDGQAAGQEPQVVRLDAADIETTATSRINYRANLPSYPITANADFEVERSELLEKTLFSRDPSAQGSGIVLADDRLKFLDRTLAGGSIKLISPQGKTVQLVLRWAKMTSVRSGGRDCWNLFYRVRKDARSGEVSWKNTGHAFVFGADGRLEDDSLVVPVIDMAIDGLRMGNVSLIFGSSGITQFADRGGLVKVHESKADGGIGGAFTGLSMSGRGRLFAHYANGTMRPLADIQFTGEESWFEEPEEDWEEPEWHDSFERRAA